MSDDEGDRFSVAAAAVRLLRAGEGIFCSSLALILFRVSARRLTSLRLRVSLFFFRADEYEAGDGEQLDDEDEVGEGHNADDDEDEEDGTFFYSVYSLVSRVLGCPWKFRLGLFVFFSWGQCRFEVLVLQ